jgi:hypothetical protein
MSDRIYESILDIHKKLDGQAKDITDVKVSIAALPGQESLITRVKILERVVYGVFAIVIGFVIMAVLDDGPKKLTADPIKVVRKFK